MPSLNLALAGNFNLVNTDELFALVNIDPGEFQKQSDLAAMMEVIHHFLVKADETSPSSPDIANILRKAVPLFAALLLAVYWGMGKDLYSGMPMGSGLLITISMMRWL